MINTEKFFAKNIAGKNDQIYDYLPATSTRGDFQRIEGLDVLINSIRTLLLTPLGYYPFDPEYGSELYKKVFDPLDDVSRDEIMFEVTERIKNFDNRIDVVDSQIYELSTDGKSYRVDVVIARGKLEGTVSVHLPGPNHQFAFEDE